MIQPFDPLTQAFLSGIAAVQTRAERAQRELSTGVRINQVSDDPDQIANLMEVRAELARATQIQSNLGRVKTETDAADAALQNAVKLMDRASVLAAQAQPSTQSAQMRSEIAGEVGAVLEQLGSISRTMVEGRYIFSGDSDRQAPYTIDMVQANPVSAYAGSAATRQVQHPDGSVFSISRTAQDIFDAANPQDNVFQAVAGLHAALMNNDQAGIESAIAALGSAATYLNMQLAFYGTVQNRVQNAVDFGSGYQSQLSVELSGIQDADLAQAITDLNQAAVQQQATLSAQAKMPRTSLFDYLG